MKYKVSKLCSDMIFKILSFDPSQRPQIKEILNSEYVKSMCKKFKWNLEKLIKFKQMKTKKIDTSNLSVQSTFGNSGFVLDKSFNYQENMSILSGLYISKPDNTIEQYSDKNFTESKFGDVSSTKAIDFVKNPHSNNFLKKSDETKIIKEQKNSQALENKEKSEFVSLQNNKLDEKIEENVLTKETNKLKKVSIEKGDFQIRISNQSDQDLKILNPTINKKRINIFSQNNYSEQSTSLKNKNLEGKFFSK